MTASRIGRWVSVLVLVSMGLAMIGNRPARGQPASAPLPPPPFAASGEEWWGDAVCYEVFVRSFFDGDGDGIGDLQGLTEKLDYINDGDPAGGSDLGATCVWLMPIMESASYHGYDVVDYYTVEADYGTNEDFRRFVDEAHRRGIRVILDLVLNHSSSEHPWFQSALQDPASPYRDWYIFEPEDPGYLGPWGAQAWHPSPVRSEFYYGIFWEGMPDLNFRHPAVTDEAKRISAFWLTEMGADGFRLDAIKHLIEDGRVQENTPETHAWLRDYRLFLDQTAPDAFTVGEIFGADAATLLPYYPDQLDAYFQFAVGQQVLTSAIGNGRALVETVGRVSTELPDQRWAPFLTNHDQARAMIALNGDIPRAKVAATALLTLPGLPFVYYGEEIGMQGNKPDERIRTPMQWSGDPGGGFTTGEPWQPFQDDLADVNVAAQAGDPDSLLNHYRRLIHLHAAHPALSHGAFVPLESNERAVAAYMRQSEDEAILMVINFGKDAIAGAVIDAAETPLAPGTHPLAMLLGDGSAAPLTVGEGGAVAGYVPMPTLSPRTGYVFVIEGGAG